VAERRMSKRVYLAGPIEKREDRQEYRDVLRNWLIEKGYEVYDPWLFEVPFLEGKGYAWKKDGDWVIDLSWREVPEFREKVVSDDMVAIRKSDAVVAYIPQPVQGTAMEIFWANHDLNIPTFVIFTREKPSVWIFRFATKIYRTITEFKNSFERDFPNA